MLQIYWLHCFKNMQPSWVSLIDNVGKLSNCFSINQLVGVNITLKNKLKPLQNVRFFNPTSRIGALAIVICTYWSMTTKMNGLLWQVLLFHLFLAHHPPSLLSEYGNIDHLAWLLNLTIKSFKKYLALCILGIWLFYKLTVFMGRRAWDLSWAGARCKNCK